MDGSSKNLQKGKTIDRRMQTATVNDRRPEQDRKYRIAAKNKPLCLCRRKKAMVPEGFLLSCAREKEKGRRLAGRAGTTVALGGRLF